MATHFHVYRQFVYRNLKRYDKNVRSLALKFGKPDKSTNAHAQDELTLIRYMLKRDGAYGLAGVYT